MKRVNRVLGRVGIVVLPGPTPAGKMLMEHANVSEAHHPARGGRTVEWMRRSARWVDYRS